MKTEITFNSAEAFERFVYERMDPSTVVRYKHFSEKGSSTLEALYLSLSLTQFKTLDNLSITVPLSVTCKNEV